MVTPLAADLVGEWVLAPEESKEGRRVFQRPQGAPRRRRLVEKMTIDADGGIRVARTGPDDRLVEQVGTWELHGAELRIAIREQPISVFMTIEVHGDRLVMLDE